MNRRLSLFAALAICGSAGAQEPPGPIAAVWSSYHDYDATTALLQQLADQFPALMKLETIGDSEQGRPVWLVTIPNPDVVPGTEGRVKVLFDGAMHGSEVIASESMLYYVQYLLNGYDTDPTAREIVDGWTTYVVPMVNPDGVMRGKTSDDYKDARKNARRVDLNRNFDWLWPPTCSSSGCPSGCTTSCYEYPGPAAFSEAESRLIRDQLASRGVFLYVNGHAGLSVEQISRPDSFENPEDEARHLEIQRCVRSISSGIFHVTPGSQRGSSKNWGYGVPMLALRETGMPTLAFVLEIYTIDAIRPGASNHWWWCRYNPPEALDDEVAQWCINGTTQWCPPTGCVPADTKGNRMEIVKNALIYLARTSVGGVSECPAP